MLEAPGGARLKLAVFAPAGVPGGQEAGASARQDTLLCAHGNNPSPGLASRCMLLGGGAVERTVVPDTTMELYRGTQWPSIAPNTVVVPWPGSRGHGGPRDC